MITYLDLDQGAETAWAETWPNAAQTATGKIHVRSRHPRQTRREGGRAFRRADRGRRDFRGRRRLSPDDPVPGQELRGAGDAGELRRHMADPQISGHPLRQRPLHLRISLQALGGRADRHRRGNPQLYGRGDRRERSRQAHPLRPPDQLGPLVQRRQPLGHRRHPKVRRPGGAFHRQLPVDVPGLLPPVQGLHPRMGRHGGLQGQDRPSADLARGPGLQGQEGDRHRVGRHGGDPGAGDRRGLQARDRAAAFAHLFHPRPQRPRPGRSWATSSPAAPSKSRRR
jgi:hypothetical protein